MEDKSLQPNSAPTAIKIIDAATNLFMQRGYTAVSITDIIKAAEVTKPTLYYYFTDKEELFVQMGLRVLATMGAQLQEAVDSASNTTERLAALAQVLLTDRDGDMRLMRHEMYQHVGPSQRERLSQAFYNRLFAPIHDVMVQGLSEGALVRYPAPILTAMFLGLSESFHEFASQRQTNNSSAETPEPFANITLDSYTMVDLFLHGVAPNSKSDGVAHTNTLIQVP
jgi:TetR/AcrR family transcriptional regulator